MKNLLLLWIGVILYTNAGIAQEINENRSNSGEKFIQPFIGVGFLPLYASLSAGFEMGNKAESGSLYGALYSKAGNINIENTFHSYFIEMNIILKRIDFKSKSTLAVETPIWLGCRNFLETFVEETHPRHNYTYIQIGSGIDLNYFFYDRQFSLFSEIGIGYGPRYNFAGNFNFSGYRFEKYSWLPRVDVGVRFDLFNRH